MKADGEQVLFRMYLRATDQHRLEPVYQRVVRAARERGLAGATVLHGVWGYGGNHEHDVPAVVEVIDAGAPVRDFLESVVVEEVRSGLVTLERAHVMMFRRRAGEAAEARLAVAPSIAALSTVPVMERSGAMDGILLRVFLGEGDVSAEGGPLYKAIVTKAREMGLRGATVLRGTMGYGVHGAVHSGQILEHAGNLPVVVEIADERGRIDTLLRFLETNVKEGMLTMEDVRMVPLGRKA